MPDASGTESDNPGTESEPSSYGNVVKNASVALHASKRLLDYRRGVFAPAGQLSRRTIEDAGLSAIAERTR